MASVRTLGGLLLWCALSTSVPGHAGVAGVDDCFGRDRQQANDCRLHVAGIHHALSTAQARYGLATPSCQFPPGLAHDELFDRLSAELRDNLRVAPDKHMNVLIAAALLQSKTCTLGVAREPDGYKAAGLLNQCQAGLQRERDGRPCAAYVRGLYEGLQQFSGFGGAREFACPPARGPRIKDMLLAFIDEAIRDPAVQQLTAGEVMAMAMARKYPCR